MRKNTTRILTLKHQAKLSKSCDFTQWKHKLKEETFKKTKIRIEDQD